MKRWHSHHQGLHTVTEYITDLNVMDLLSLGCGLFDTYSATWRLIALQFWICCYFYWGDLGNEFCHISNLLFLSSIEAHFCKNTLVYICAEVLSHVQFFATLWTVACQAPLFMGFSGQKYWCLRCPKFRFYVFNFSEIRLRLGKMHLVTIVRCLLVNCILTREIQFLLEEIKDFFKLWLH